MGGSSKEKVKKGKRKGRGREGRGERGKDKIGKGLVCVCDVTLKSQFFSSYTG